MKSETLKKELLSARRVINKVLDMINANPELFGEVKKEDNTIKDESFMQDALDEWNKELGAKCTLNSSVIRMFNGRLKTYSKHDIMSAIRSRLATVKESKWHNEPKNRPYMVDLGYVIGTDQKLEKYLNSYSQSELFSIKEVTIGKKETSSKNIMD